MADALGVPRLQGLADGGHLGFGQAGPLALRHRHGAAERSADLGNRYPQHIQPGHHRQAGGADGWEQRQQPVEHYLGWGWLLFATGHCQVPPQRPPKKMKDVSGS